MVMVMPYGYRLIFFVMVIVITRGYGNGDSYDDCYYTVMVMVMVM